MAPSSPKCRLFILIVDDDDNAAQRLALLLRVLGHEVFIAHSEDHAERTLLVHPSDVILIHTGQNGEDGYAVAKRLSGPMRKRPMLVAMTGRHGVVGGLLPPHGFDHCVQSPVDAGELAELLRKPAPCV